METTPTAGRHLQFDEQGSGDSPQLPQWFTGLLAHNRWIGRSRPFPHVYARDVFIEGFYTRLAEEFERLRRERPELFTAVTKNYSATGVNLTALTGSPFELFLSRAWNDLIAGVAGVHASGDLEGGLHHHEPDSPRGWPHHDLNPAWFPGPPPEPGAVGLSGDGVDLRTGAHPDGVAVRQQVRAVAVLFYLANPPWQPGAGGETALYSDPSGEPVLSVPPLNNSMVVFECTPRSWHAFAGGNTAPRNSVAMWLHRPRAEAERRWGGAGIAEW